MKIVLINPPQIFSKTQVSAGVIPPLSLMYLAAYVRKKHQVALIDAVAEAPDKLSPWKEGLYLRGLTYEEIIDRIPEDAGLVGITNLFSFAFPMVVELCKTIKKKRKAKIVLGGAHPSAMPKESLEQSDADFVIISEGEETLMALCRHLEGKGKIEKIDGIAFRKGKRIMVNPKTKFITDLDSLPFPARDLLPLEKYWKTREAHGPVREKWTPIISSRGCPYNCTFCTSPLWNFCWRSRSPKNVVDEIEYCVKELGITEFHFEDENMTLDKKRLLEICDEIIRRNLKIKWQTPNGIRASVTDREMLEAMKKSGCTHITVAPESGSKRVLEKIINKKQNPEDVIRVVRDASEIGLKTAAFFIMGLPGEEKEDIEETIALMKELAKAGLDEIDVGLFIPLPGSVLYEKLKKEGKISEDLEELVCISDFARAKSWSDISAEDLDQYRKRAFLAFYATQAVHHPTKLLKTFYNLSRGKEETKTERTLRVLLKRLKK